MMSIASLGLDKNLSFFTVPVVFLATCIGPHAYAILSARKLYDNANPRRFNEAVAKDESLDKPTQQRVLRAQASSDNSFESFSMFATGVIAGNVAHLDNFLLNCLSIGYLVTRVAYIGVYVRLQDDRRFHVLRSALWETAFTIAATLWVKAGLKLMHN